MLLESILCQFGLICERGNALKLLESTLCKFWQICATGMAPIWLQSISCEFERICATGKSLMLLESILCKFWQICATGNALMQLETIVCKFGQICVTGNPFQWLAIDRNSILNFPAKIRTGMCAESFCVVTGDDSSHSQGQSGKRLLLASRGHPIRTPLYHGSCIDPTHQSHTLDPTPDTPGA